MHMTRCHTGHCNWKYTLLSDVPDTEWLCTRWICNHNFRSSVFRCKSHKTYSVFTAKTSSEPKYQEGPARWAAAALTRWRNINRMKHGPLFVDFYSTNHGKSVSATCQPPVFITPFKSSFAVSLVYMWTIWMLSLQATCARRTRYVRQPYVAPKLRCCQPLN